MKYRKKPVVIEAIQFTNNVDEIESFVGNELAGNMNGTNEVQELIIPTLEGEMTARQGDWIIKGVNGEFYPCKPDIFEKTYSPVDESPSAPVEQEGQEEMWDVVIGICAINKYKNAMTELKSKYIITKK